MPTHYEADIDHVDLHPVLDLLRIHDSEVEEKARHRIHGCLESFQSALTTTERAHSVSDDAKDLDQLLILIGSYRDLVLNRQLVESLDSLGRSNPVLRTRIEMKVGAQRLHENLSLTQSDGLHSPEALQDLTHQLSDLRDEIQREDGRGRPTDRAARRLAFCLYDVWVEFTGRGTSRQNAAGRQADPFGDFVNAAGKLIDPHFNGYHAAREVHEHHRPGVSGDD